MTDLRTALKPLIAYAICMSVAALVGYLVAQPLDMGGFVLMMGGLCVLISPLLIRYHYPLMLLALNSGAMVFFLPGSMQLWMVAVAISFFISFTHKILDDNISFLSVPQLTHPLITLAVVVIATAELRGGIAMRSMGGENAGGRRYVELLIAILGYFALSARTIPRERVGRYIGLFFLSGAVAGLSIMYGHIPGIFNFIFLFIPLPPVTFSDAAVDAGWAFGAVRPLAAVGGAVAAFLLARYGIRRIFELGRIRLFVLLSVAFLMVCLSGSRLVLVTWTMVFALQFWLEGLFRTKLALGFGLSLILGATAVVPLVPRLPLMFQRTLSVLPVNVDPVVRASAEGSSEWRREIWRVVLPQIPNYLLLGKGYAISQSEYEFATDPAFFRDEPEDRAATVAGDYHNGPLSVIVPFGIWGVIAFLWLLGGGVHVLWQNYRHGAVGLRVTNTYLLSSYLTSIATFMFVFGGLYSGLAGFTGILGLSVALNGGVARSAAPSTMMNNVGREFLGDLTRK